MRRPLCLLALCYAVVVFLVVRGFDLARRPVLTDTFRLTDAQELPVTLQGRIREVTVSGTGEERETKILLQDVSDAAGRTNGKKFYIRMTLQGPGEKELQPGTRITVRGILRRITRATNPGEFDAQVYYRILRINYILTRPEVLRIEEGTEKSLRVLLQRIRGRGLRVLREQLPEREAGVLAAMLFGVKDDLNDAQKSLYQANGIAHILAISGLHISMLGMGLFHLLKRTGMKERYASAGCMLFLILYGLMIGGSPSAVRAILMFSLYRLASLLHRTYDLQTGIAVAGLLILFTEPLYILHTGFLFSFSAVLSIALLSPLLPGPQGFRTSLSVVIGTLPISLLTSGAFSPYAVFLNLLVVPLVEVVLVGAILLEAAGGLFFPGGFALRPLCVLLSAVIGYVLRFFDGLALAAEALPGSRLVWGSPGVLRILLFLLILGALLFAEERGREEHALLRRGVLLASMLLVLALPGKRAAGLELWMLDVGQGDGLLLREGDRNWMIDGGSSSRREIAAGVLLPALSHFGIDRIDTWVITHGDDDHCNGLLQVLQMKKERISEGKIDIGRILLPGVWSETADENTEAILKMSEELGIPVCFCTTGQVLSLGEKTELLCLNPAAGGTVKDINEASLTFLLRREDTEILLTGDLEKEAEEEATRLLEKMPGKAATRILKVGHHGSRFSSSETFLAAFPPDYALISAGRGNRYGHPHAETMERLENTGARLFSTQESGAIRVWQKKDKTVAETFLRGNF